MQKKFCFSPCFARQGRCLKKAIREAGSGRRQRKTTEGAEVRAPTRLGGEENIRLSGKKSLPLFNLGGSG